MTAKQSAIFQKSSDGVTMTLDGQELYFDHDVAVTITASDNLVAMNIEGHIYHILLTATITLPSGVFSGTAAALREALSEVFNRPNTIESVEGLQTALDAKANLKGVARQVLASNVPLSHTGNTTETTVYSGVIPGGSVGVNGSFDIRLFVSLTNNANTKIFRVKFNGTTVMQVSHSNAASSRIWGQLSNRNSLTAQVGALAAAGNAAGTGPSTGAAGTYSFNTGADITVAITIQHAASADSAAVESFQIIAVN